MSEKLSGRKHGVLFGIGVGPGDPELLTLKALRILNEVKYIAYPGKSREECLAYNIIKNHITSDDKEYICCYAGMNKDYDQLNIKYRSIADSIIDILNRGEDVAFLTIGDPTIYSAYYYVHKIVRDRGYEPVIISGVPSFCAASARLDISLAERDEAIQIIPGSYEVESKESITGTKIIMKAGSAIDTIIDDLRKSEADVYMVENCGLENEKVYYGTNDLNLNAGYMSLIVVKPKKDDR